MLLTQVRNSFTCFIAPQHPRNPMINKIEPTMIKTIAIISRYDKPFSRSGSLINKTKKYDFTHHFQSNLLALSGKNSFNF